MTIKISLFKNIKNTNNNHYYPILWKNSTKLYVFISIFLKDIYWKKFVKVYFHQTLIVTENYPIWNKLNIQLEININS